VESLEGSEKGNPPEPPEFRCLKRPSTTLQANGRQNIGCRALPPTAGCFSRNPSVASRFGSKWPRFASASIRALITGARLEPKCSAIALALLR